MQRTYLLVVFAIVVLQTHAGIFPESIKKCKISDSKFNECVLNSANDLLPTIINGDEQYGIEPLQISKLTRTYNFTDTFGIRFTNLNVRPSGDLVIMDIHFDFHTKLLTFTAQICPLKLTANYETVGIRPGNQKEGGFVTMTFDNVQFDVSMPLQFKTVDDKKYLEAMSCKLRVDGRNFQFKPSVRWRTAQGPGGEAWENFEEELKAGISKIPERMKAETEQLNGGVVKALNKIFKLLPFEELFIP